MQLPYWSRNCARRDIKNRVIVLMNPYRNTTNIYSLWHNSYQWSLWSRALEVSTLCSCWRFCIKTLPTNIYSLWHTTLASSYYDQGKWSSLLEICSLFILALDFTCTHCYKRIVPSCWESGPTSWASLPGIEKLIELPSGEENNKYQFGITEHRELVSILQQPGSALRKVICLLVVFPL